MFKKKAVKYNNSFNSKNKGLNNNELLNSPAKNAYILNRSEPFLYTPQINNNKMAYLMTPCYIIDNDDINYRNIKEYNKKINKDLINGFFLSSPQKKIFYRTKSSDFLKNDDPFYYTYMKNATTRKNNDSDNFNLYSDRNKIFFPSSRDNSTLFDNNIKRIENRSRVEKIRKINSLDNKKLISLNKNQLIFDPEKFPNFYDSSDTKNLYNKYKKRYRNKNHNPLYNPNNNDLFTLGGENNTDKGITRNRPINSKNNNYFDLIKNYRKENINREILNHLYDNNYMNNNHTFGVKGHKKDYLNYNKNNKKNKNILNTNTDRKPKDKYSIFKNDNVDISRVNKSIYRLFPSKENNKEHPYNKILNIGPSSNFALINSGKKSTPFDKDKKKINNSNSNNNNSNNSNSQSNNNIGANHISTNYTGGHSYYSSNKENQKQIINNKARKSNNKSENRSKPITPLEVSPVFVNEYFRDNIGKRSNSSSNKVSLQSLSDSKMLELAGHYGMGDESSSDNYQMNNVIHNKKKFSKCKV
jgi:hypothetical protein